jgi:signal transduction histidine kinase
LPPRWEIGNHVPLAVKSHELDTDNALTVGPSSSTPSRDEPSIYTFRPRLFDGPPRDMTIRSFPAEAAPSRYDRRKETFVSTLAHELRQPLSALVAAVELVRRTPNFAAGDCIAALMKRQIDQMDATRWAHGNVTILKQRIDVRELVRDAAIDISGAVAERGHELVVVTASDPLWADVDPQRLQQVLSNLLRNAVKYTDPGGRISIAADRDGAATVTLSVRDTGRGIEPEALTHIFELFSQVRPLEAAGLGIGLSVVREIVALHHGRIEARSAGPGHGTEFIVALPVAPAPSYDSERRMSRTIRSSVH